MITAIALSLLVTADVACAESGHAWDDAEAVLAVVVNRHRAWGRPLLRVVTRPRQFARGCVASGKADRLDVRHLAASVRAHLGWLRRPSWLTGDTLWFCSAPRGGCARWSWVDRLERAGATPAGHVYWRARRRG